jgi:hypothetical protein
MSGLEQQKMVVRRGGELRATHTATVSAKDWVGISR